MWWRTLSTEDIKQMFQFQFFLYGDSCRYTHLTRVQFTSRYRHVCMTLCEIASGDLWLANFVCSGIHFMVHPSAMQPHEGILTPSRSRWLFIDLWRMKALVGLSECELITHSRLLRVDQVAPPVSEPVDCWFWSRQANHSIIAPNIALLC